MVGNIHIQSDFGDLSLSLSLAFTQQVQDNHEVKTHLQLL